MVVFVVFEVFWLLNWYGFAVGCGFGCYGGLARFGGLPVVWCECSSGLVLCYDCLVACGWLLWGVACLLCGLIVLI